MPEVIITSPDVSIVVVTNRRHVIVVVYTKVEVTVVGSLSLGCPESNLGSMSSVSPPSLWGSLSGCGVFCVGLVGSGSDWGS